jgi:hypothetical protein
LTMDKNRTNNIGQPHLLLQLCPPEVKMDSGRDGCQHAISTIRLAESASTGRTKSTVDLNAPTLMCHACR